MLLHTDTDISSKSSGINGQRMWKCRMQNLRPHILSQMRENTNFDVRWKCCCCSSCLWLVDCFSCFVYNFLHITQAIFWCGKTLIVSFGYRGVDDMTGILTFSHILKARDIVFYIWHFASPSAPFVPSNLIW